MRQGMKKAGSCIEEVDIDGAFDALKQIILWRVKSQMNAGQLVDYSLMAEERIRAYEKREDVGGLLGVPTGNSLLDENTGGQCPGDLWVTIGRIGVGKTWELLSFFHEARLAGVKPLFISLELPLEEICDRYDPMQFGFKSASFRKAHLTTAQKERYFAELRSMVDENGAGRNWWMCDSGFITSLDDINMAILHLAPDIVFIDAVYLLGDMLMDERKRVTYNIVTCKKIALHHKIPIHVTSQINRKVFEDSKGRKKKKYYKAGLQHASYTDAIGASCDLLMALQWDKDNERQKKMLIDVLKNRRERPFGFLQNWDFDAMNFGLIGEMVDNEVIDKKPEQVPF
jgi:replicative DNA helicase